MYSTCLLFFLFPHWKAGKLKSCLLLLFSSFICLICTHKCVHAHIGVFVSENKVVADLLQFPQLNIMFHAESSLTVSISLWSFHLLLEEEGMIESPLISSTSFLLFLLFPCGQNWKFTAQRAELHWRRSIQTRPCCSVVSTCKYCQSISKDCSSDTSQRCIKSSGDSTRVCLRLVSASSDLTLSQ